MGYASDQRGSYPAGAMKYPPDPTGFSPQCWRPTCPRPIPHPLQDEPSWEPMADPPLDTLRMHRCVKRWQAGDPEAADDLLRAVGRRLEHLTRKMLRGFPAVQGHAETADVLQGSLLRLLNTLRRV